METPADSVQKPAYDSEIFSGSRKLSLILQTFKKYQSSAAYSIVHG